MTSGLLCRDGAWEDIDIEQGNGPGSQLSCQSI